MSVLKTKFAAAAAKRLRGNSTDAERQLWSRLRNRGLRDAKFVRQQPIGPYIADLACREADLIVELDGGQHVDAAEADALRTQVLASHGYRVIRFFNTDVLTNIDGVLTVIAAELEKAPHPDFASRSPTSPPKGEVVPADTMGSRP